MLRIINKRCHSQLVVLYSMRHTLELMKALKMSSCHDEKTTVDYSNSKIPKKNPANDRLTCSEEKSSLAITIHLIEH